MKDKGRYDVSASLEAQFEPGSNDTVLRNRLGIADSGVMDRVEAEALIKATDALFHEYDVDHKFSAGDICHMHKVWLGDIYEWAGNYRSVNISMGDFSFAMAAQIPKLMNQFEKNQLAKYTPCDYVDRNEVVKALAEVHTELVLIHPFRLLGEWQHYYNWGRPHSAHNGKTPMERYFELSDETPYSDEAYKDYDANSGKCKVIAP